MVKVAEQQADEDDGPAEPAEPAEPAAVEDVSSDGEPGADEVAPGHSSESEAEEGSSQHDSVLSAETLELPGRGDDAGSDSSEGQQDSQVKGSWWGKAYQVLGRIEKLERKKVPMDMLAEMHFNGLIPEEYEGTFSLEDLQYLVEVVEEHSIFLYAQLRCSATKK